MKQLAVILIMGSLLAQTFGRLLTVVDYRLNQDYIAKYLCENRDRPMLHCNGQCVLMKKLKQQQQQEQRTGRHHGKDEVISSKNHYPALVHRRKESRFEYGRFNETFCSGFYSSCFRPPQV